MPHAIVHIPVGPWLAQGCGMWHNSVEMTDQIEQSSVRVGPQGRLVIPVHLRRALDIHPGQTLVARAEDGRLVLEPREAIIARLQSRFQSIPPEVSLVDELIAERRMEGGRESAE